VCLGAAPTRFCALCAALRADVRRPLVVGEDRARRWLGAQPTAMLRLWGEDNPEIDRLVAALGRLGLRTLGQLEGLGRDAMADRFGQAGILAHRLACGEDTPLHPRHVEERLEETLELGEASLGPALEQVLGVLVERLLSRPERRGRTVRAATLSARLVEGGTWRERVAFRQALADGRRMRLALSLRLALLPAPVEALGLAAERLGPVGGEQGGLLEQDRVLRRARLAEALHQVRATAGRDAALRIVCVDPGSRVPERRVALAPFPG
jgi:protein ImuB